MKEFTRKTLESLNKAFQLEAMIGNALFLLAVLFLIGYALYLGWRHLH